MTGRRRRHHGRLAVTALALLIAATIAACGDEGGAPEAQPSPGGTGFVDGEFDELPVPPLAVPLGPRREKEGVLSRSWSVRNTTAAEVLDFYERTLGDRWQVSTPPRPLGDAYRGEWRAGDDELRVSAVPAPAADVDARPQPAGALVQLSLQLLPAG